MFFESQSSRSIRAYKTALRESTYLRNQPWNQTWNDYKNCRYTMKYYSKRQFLRFLPGHKRRINNARAHIEIYDGKYGADVLNELFEIYSGSFELPPEPDTAYEDIDFYAKDIADDIDNSKDDYDITEVEDEPGEEILEVEEISAEKEGAPTIEELLADIRQLISSQ